MKQALLFTCLAIFLVQLDATILFIAFPAISASFPRISAAGLSWVLNIYTLTFGAALIPAGALGDRLGRKKTFLLGTAIFTLASLLCGLSTSSESLIAFRFVQAVGAALLVPSSLGLLLEKTPREQRSVAVSIWGATAALAAALGPALGGLLIAQLGWHWVFFINVPIGLFVFVAGARLLPKIAPHPDAKVPSLLSAALIMAAMACLSYALLSEAGDASEHRLSFLFSGLVLLAAFLAHCRFSKSPTMDLELFKNREFSLANFQTFLYFMAFSILFFGNVQTLLFDWHFTVVTTGLLLLPGPLFVIPTALISGQLMRKHGPRPLIITGSLVLLTGIGFILLRPLGGDSVALGWMPGWILVGIGNGMVMPSLSTAATLDLPVHRYAMGGGVNNSIRQFGSLIGISIAVLVLGSLALASPSETTERFTRLFSVASGLVLVVFCLSLTLKNQPIPATAPLPVIE